MCIPIFLENACGNLSEAIQENGEYFPISETVLGSGEFFVLTANGDSMIDAGIEDGDLIIIKQQSTADNGQIVLAIMIAFGIIKIVSALVLKLIERRKNKN